jgi:hypothetical protein
VIPLLIVFKRVPASGAEDRTLVVEKDLVPTANDRNGCLELNGSLPHRLSYLAGNRRKQGALFIA